jgi:hypothetical protein
MTTLNFDATTVAPSQGPELLPAGWYVAIIDQSEDKPTKDGLGSYLQMRFKVIEGQYVGATFFARLNLRNGNPDTVRISKEQLSAICHAAGHLRVQDSQELHGKPMRVKLKVRKDKTGEYEDQNEIAQWKNLAEPIPGMEATAPPAGFAQAPAGFAAQMAQAPAAQAPQASAENAHASWAGNSAPQQYAAPVEQAAPQAQGNVAYAAPAPAATQSWVAPAATQPWQEQSAPTPQAQAAPQAQAPAHAAPQEPPHAAQAAPPPWGTVA